MEGVRPKVSTPRPLVNTPTPKLSTPRPKVSTPRPKESTLRPKVSTPRPSVSTPSPLVSTPRPLVRSCTHRALSCTITVHHIVYWIVYLALFVEGARALRHLLSRNHDARAPHEVAVLAGVAAAPAGVGTISVCGLS
eukprot:scaffold107530_cov115-Phaeocystis_antarctica.AAC.1